MTQKPKGKRFKHRPRKHHHHHGSKISMPQPSLAAVWAQFYAALLSDLKPTDLKPIHHKDPGAELEHLAGIADLALAEYQSRFTVPHGS